MATSRADLPHLARRIAFDQLVVHLQAEVEAGTVNTTADGPLVLYKYTPACAFEKRWSPWSKIARGLILDHAAQRVVATPFEKFFNWSEGETPGEAMAPLPDGPFEVTTKVDGSLAIVFHHGDRWRVATRGSFRSEQAQWAEAWLVANVHVSELQRGTTYLAEIVYAANRIVVSYDFDGLVLLSAYNAEGYELDREALAEAAWRAGFRLVEVVQADGIDALLMLAKTLPATDEGFVIRFQSGLRLKIKGDEYCRIHRLVSRVTPLAVWEMLIMGDDLEAVARQLPEEFQKDFTAITELLQATCASYVSAIARAHEATQAMTDKDLGLWLPTQTTYAPDVARWIFPARKKGLLRDVHVAGSALRRKVFEIFRPTGNALAGYVPSSAMNRFAAEEAT